MRTWCEVKKFASQKFRLTLVSNKISDLCEISDLLVFFSYFAFQNKEIMSGNYFFDVFCIH